MIQLTKNNVTKKVATGYSWKSLLFGTLYPIALGDFNAASRHFLWHIFTCGVCMFTIPFRYNKRRLKEYIEDGWKPLTEKDELYLDHFNWYKA